MLTPTVQVNVLFEQANGISEDSSVLLNGVKIGEVKSVTTKGKQVELILQLSVEKAKGVQTNAAAIVEGTEPANVVIYNPSTTAKTVQAGDTLFGLNSSLEFAAWRAGDSISSTVEQVSKFVHTYFEGEEWNKTKKEMNDLLGALEKQGRATHDDLARDFEELTNNLESQSEKALEEAQKSIDALAGKIEELRNQGQDEMARMLQLLIEELNRALGHKRQPVPTERSI
ncbi:MlaD family protein [Pseudomonadota bacterium]